MISAAINEKLCPDDAAKDISNNTILNILKILLIIKCNLSIVLSCFLPFHFLAFIVLSLFFFFFILVSVWDIDIFHFFMKLIQNKG